MALSNFDRFLLRNGGQLEQLDKYVTYLTMIVPGQTPTIELACEAVVSTTTILQVYKNQLVAKLTSKSQKSLNSKYLDAEYSLHKHYRTLAYVLSVIKSTELLAEMTACHYKGNRGRWNAILGIEALKAVIRLAMLLISRKVLPSGVPLHDANLDHDEIQKLVECHETGAGSSFAKFNMSLSSGLVTRELKPANLDQLRAPINLVRRVNPQQAVSEILGILRPLIYATLLYKYRAHRKSWTPWLIGISLEFVSRELAKGSIHGSGKMSGLEKEIYGHRGSDMIWWLMRSAAYEHYTRGYIMGIAGKLSRIPLLNLAGRLMEDGIEYFDEYYFATATL